MQKTQTTKAPVDSPALAAAKELALKAKAAGRKAPPSATALLQMGERKANAAAKAAQKPAKAETQAADTTAKAEGKTPFYAAILAAVVAGKFGQQAAAYYKRANQYHAKAGTVFPRARNAGTLAAMMGEGRAKAEEKAKAIIGKAANGTLAPGDMEGQALYDAMKAGLDLPAA